MSKKEEFVKFIKEVFSTYHVSEEDMPEAVKIYWENLCNKEEVEKPLFTDNGKMILSYLQDNPDTTSWKAKDIAEGLFTSSKTVSGAMRKLVTDGYIEKVGENPSVYSITEKGKNIEIV